MLALFWMKDLSSSLRDQLMVSEQDRALVEARARGLSEAEILTATTHPWRQILKWDLIGSAVGISLFLLVYYAASAFFTIYWATVFKSSDGLNLTTSDANYLNTWYWGADAVALIIFGVLSDKLRVRKPLMLVGAAGSIVMLILFLRQADHPYTGFGTLITLEVLLAAFISLTYAPWMAAYTEMVEAKNPALVGTGLALWGWILRLTVGLSFIFLPLVVNAVNPVVDNLVYAQTPPDRQRTLQRPGVPAGPSGLGDLRRGQRQLADGPELPAERADRRGRQQAPDPGQPGRLREGGRPGRLRQGHRPPDRPRQVRGALRVPAHLPVGPSGPAGQAALTAWPSHPSSGSTGSGCAWAAWCCSSPPSS